MNRLIQFKTITLSLLIALTLACFALSPVAQAKKPSEDRGNGNSAAENVDALNIATTGSDNTAHGWFSLFSNTTELENTADGFQALYSNTEGFDNTATGVNALFSNTTGVDNVANGTHALFSNTNGGDNVATGAFALWQNTDGGGNTANGSDALSHNTTGFNNTAIGFTALVSNTTGNANTATGEFALWQNTEGDDNTAIGGGALYSNTAGANNVALGSVAGSNATTGSNNVYIGAGMMGVAGESNACYIGSIFGQTSAGGIAVFVNANGKLGTITSSRRFKEEIEPIQRASEVLFALKPVTFRYKKGIDPQGIPQFGLVAEDVEAVNPDLVVRDKEGKPYSVRYEQVNAMLLNEFLKEHKAFVEEQHNLEKLQATVARQQKQIEALTVNLQKVSAQMEVSKTVPQVVNNER
jgi:Chaperone of endosialidase